MDFQQELTRLADGYRQRGYDVAVRPGPDQLPGFAKDFHIEIVGRRGGEGVLVAVKRNRDAVAADSEMPRYAEITGAQPGWRFDFAILEAENPAAREMRGVREFNQSDIEASLDQAQELIRIGFARPAVIAAWAAFEAAMRMRLRALGRTAGVGSVPREMIRELYSAGVFAPEEFHQVETAASLRNQFVHGFASPVDSSANSEADVVGQLGRLARRLANESLVAAQGT